MALTKVTPAVFAVANNVTSNTLGTANLIPQLVFDAQGVVTSAANTLVKVYSNNVSNGAINVAHIDVSSSNGTGAMIIPNGTTAQRPTGANGAFRYNSTTNYYEYWDPVLGAWTGINQFAATGGSITTAGLYTYHTFTTSGTFTVTSGSKNIDYLVVAGGGGGGTYNNGAGGGAGGYVAGAQTFSPGSYTVTVGSGGSQAPKTQTLMYPGSPSSVTGLTTAVGGGGGAGNTTGPNYPTGYSGAPGGSGGGGAGSGAGSGGSGTPGQGTAGGNSSATNNAGGGGGGAGAAGGNGGPQGGTGGNGLNWQSLGTYYAGGGGGGTHYQPGISGGSGGGGASGSGAPGISAPASDGTAGSPGTGGGGGAGSYSSSVGTCGYGGAGGGGIVIFRYLT